MKVPLIPVRHPISFSQPRGYIGTEGPSISLFWGQKWACSLEATFPPKVGMPNVIFPVSRHLCGKSSVWGVLQGWVRVTGVPLAHVTIDSVGQSEFDLFGCPGPQFVKVPKGKSFNNFWVLLVGQLNRFLGARLPQSKPFSRGEEAEDGGEQGANSTATWRPRF